MTPEQESALSKLEAGTHVLVPVEPTEAMIVEGLDHSEIDAPNGWPQEARALYGGYRAMLTAAQEGE